MVADSEACADKHADQDIARLCGGFGCPSEPFCEAVFACVTAGWATSVLNHITARARADPRYHDLASYLLRYSPALDNWVALEPIFGEASDVLAGRSSNLARVLCNLGLVFAQKKLTGNWRIQLDSPTRFRAGCVLLPEASHFELAGSTVMIDDRPAPNESESQLASSIEMGGASIFCYTGDIKNCADLDVVAKELRSLLRGASPRAISGGLDLLKLSAPEYLVWIGRVIRTLLVLESSNGFLESGSYARRLGMVRVSSDPRAAAVAEMLVHETAHQYFYLTERLGPVLFNDPEDSFYSPLKQRSRPIHKIFLGYHAFGNVLLMHRQVLRTGMREDAFSRESFERTRADVETMADTLERHAQFTPFGRVLYDALSAQLHL